MPTLKEVGEGRVVTVRQVPSDGDCQLRALRCAEIGWVDASHH